MQSPQITRAARWLVEERPAPGESRTRSASRAFGISTASPRKLATAAENLAATYDDISSAAPRASAGDQTSLLPLPPALLTSCAPPHPSRDIRTSLPSPPRAPRRAAPPPPSASAPPPRQKRAPVSSHPRKTNDVPSFGKGAAGEGRRRRRRRRRELRWRWGGGRPGGDQGEGLAGQVLGRWGIFG